MQNKTDLFDYGSPDAVLSPDELFPIVEQTLKNIAAKTRVIAIIPDKTCDDNTDLLFPFAARILAECGVSKFDALVAQGTHVRMTQQEKLIKIGITNLSQIPNLGQTYNHNWSNPEELIGIGELSAKQVKELTDGLIENSIVLTINRLLAPGEYDLILIFGATVPHEVA
jgi:lactate racemase